MKLFSEGSSETRKLYIDQLKQIYSAELQVLEAMPEMIERATGFELKEGFEAHLNETHVHVSRLETILPELASTASEHECRTISVLISEMQKGAQEAGDGPIGDALIISAGQRVEHFEIASYETLLHFAQTLGETAHAELLQQTLDEEENADRMLSEVANRSNTSAPETVQTPSPTVT